MAYTTPITWTNGAVTAASVNEQVRDNVTYLKAALDLITNSTTADSGTGTYISVTRSDTGADVAHFRALMSGDTQARWIVYFDDSDNRIRMGWGDGTSLDTYLERVSSTVLSLTGDSALRNTWSAGTSNVYFTGRASGDSVDRVRVLSTSAGGGELAVGDGTTSNYGRLYYDVTNTQVALVSTATNGLYIGAEVVVGDNTASHRLVFTPDATPYIEFGNDASTTLVRSAAGKLTVPRLIGTDGLTTKAVASAVTDGDFSYSGESGLMGLDTQNGFLAVRDGSTWRGIDTRGDMTHVGPFVLTNVATSATSDMGYGYLDTWVPFDDAATYNVAPSGTARMPAPWGGSIVGISVRSSELRTAGTATFKGTISGSATSTLSAQLNGTDTFTDTGSVLASTETFTAGQTLGVTVTTASWTPTTAKFTADLYVLYRRGDFYS